MLLNICFCGLLTQGFSYNMSVVQANAFPDVNLELVQFCNWSYIEGFQYLFIVEYGGELQFTACDEQVNLKAASLEHILC